MFGLVVAAAVFAVPLVVPTPCEPVCTDVERHEFFGSPAATGTSSSADPGPEESAAALLTGELSNPLFSELIEAVFRQRRLQT